MPFFAFGLENGEEPKPPKIGIFSMPITQQPGPFISFGQNIIDKGDLQIFLLADQLKGEDKKITHIVPSTLYGLTQTLSLFISAPYFLQAQESIFHSSGFGDSLVQLEYSFYQKDTYEYAQLATAVGGILFPTGSSRKTPPTGTGSPQFFFGTTLNRTYFNWYVFISPGTLQTTTNEDDKKFGNLYLYQFGIGRSLYTIDTRLLIAAMIELDGTYSEKDRIHGEVDPNTGGNIVLLTPSIWVSGQHLTLQFGVGFPIVQHLNGIQRKNYHLIVGSLAWFF